MQIKGRAVATEYKLFQLVIYLKKYPVRLCKPHDHVSFTNIFTIMSKMAQDEGAIALEITDQGGIVRWDEVVQHA